MRNSAFIEVYFGPECKVLNREIKEEEEEDTDEIAAANSSNGSVYLAY